MFRKPEKAISVTIKASWEWRYDYNFVRVHEALGMETPATVYTVSPRKFEGYVEEITYPSGYESRKVDTNGFIKWSSQKISISTVFRGYHLGLTSESENILRDGSVTF